MPKKQNLEQVTRYADMLSAMGTEPRLRIMQLLLSNHPEGLIVSEIGSALQIPSSTLSHHLEKLKNEDLVKVRREGTFLYLGTQAGSLCYLARRSGQPGAWAETPRRSSHGLILTPSAWRVSS
jgi:DNA-binding transcriptional ArsR family regulator